MPGARRDGLTLLLLGALVFLSFGICFERSSSVGMVDFGVVYFPAKCLIQGGDPYNETDVLRVFQAQQGDRLWSSPREREMMTRLGYPPPTLAVTAPLATLSWGAAHILWMAFIAGFLIVSAFIMWSLCADYAPVLSGALIGFLLANCQATMVLGNASAIAIGLCAIAVWCFVRNRYTPVGVICLAVSLALKPHIAWIIWLYFLLSGGVYRKRALQTFGAIAILGIPMVLWVWRVAPNWFSEMRSNLVWFSGPGGPCDPGPKSGGSHGMDMLVNLQAVVSVFRDDPSIYQPVAYGISAVLLLAWAVVTIRSHGTPRTVWMAIASASALSMLPFYHHVHDAKLMLLAVPACVQLWAEDRRIGRAAVVITSIAFIFTADFVWVFVLIVLHYVPPPSSWLGGKALIALQVFPAPLAVLLLGVFYLWVFAYLAQTRVHRQELAGR